jgi:hypothetical protein
MEIVRSRKFTDWWASSRSSVSHLSIPKVRSALNCSQAASADLVDELVVAGGIQIAGTLLMN